MRGGGCRIAGAASIPRLGAEVAGSMPAAGPRSTSRRRTSTPGDHQAKHRGRLRILDGVRHARRPQRDRPGRARRRRCTRSREVPVGMPAESAVAVAATAVASRPLSVSSCCCRHVPRATCSSRRSRHLRTCVAVDDAMTAVTSVLGSAGTVIGAGSKYWHARFAGVVTVDQVAGYAIVATFVPPADVRSQVATVAGDVGTGVGFGVGRLGRRRRTRLLGRLGRRRRTRLLGGLGGRRCGGLLGRLERRLGARGLARGLDLADQGDLRGRR